MWLIKRCEKLKGKENYQKRHRNEIRSIMRNIKYIAKKVKIF